MAVRENQSNLQGLLKFALRQSTAEGGATSAELSEMSEDKKLFLESALKNMSVDIIQEFHKAISILENSTSSVNERVDALKFIRDYIDNLDFANSFVKVGGTKTLIEHCGSEESPVKVNAMYIIAEMSQNNPFCQQHFIEADVLPLFISCFDQTEDVAASALHAVSALIKNYNPGLIAFVKIGGLHSLLTCLSTPYTKVFIKACFLMGCLAKEHSDVRDNFLLKSAISTLCSKLDTVRGFDVKIETILFAVASIVSNAQLSFKNEINQKSVEIINTLIKQNRDLPECEEMMTHANTILENLKRQQQMC